MDVNLDSRSFVADLGFRVRWDVATGDHDAVLAIALRDRPTERHYDPELIAFWRVGPSGRGHRAEIAFTSAMPILSDYSWGPIEIVDRFGVRNTFTSFGGTLSAERTDPGRVTVTFRSRAPILRRGGHSQRYDRLAEKVTGFFGRILVPIDFQVGAEALIASRPPLVLYAAFLRHELSRLEAGELVRDAYGRSEAHFVLAEAQRAERRDPVAWEAGGQLLFDRPIEFGVGS